MSEAFEIKGTSFPMTVLKILEPNLNRLQAQLTIKMARANDFFQDAPIMLDVSALKEDVTLDWQELIQILRRFRLVPAGVQHAHTKLEQSAIDAGLGVIKKSTNTNRDEELNLDIPPEPMMINMQVRGGQKHYAQNRDLVSLVGVNVGGEVLADGNIYIYGALRGRALAGARGNRKSRIFCMALEAELIAIAGIYQVNEYLPDAFLGKPAQIFLEEDRLNIMPLVL
ncbi:septum site-determining protein MinC [Magnetococcales bacterium HHB-1]